MSCETKPASLSHLAVKSAVDVHKCKLSRGNSARHAVSVRNYSAVEVEVEIEVECPSGAGLEHACGNPWQPPSRYLTASKGGVSTTTFEEYLHAPNAAAGSGKQQLKLTVRRRPLRQAKWIGKTAPLRDIEVV
ncbi:MAG TPA: hypothetical protein VF712_18405 [Thermoleophilaceae bacterium]|jgi:hypothetical protein